MNSEEWEKELRKEYEEKDPGYAFGLFSLLHYWQSTGRASLKLTKEQVDLIYDALALHISNFILPHTVAREPLEVVGGGDSVFRLMTDKGHDSSTRIALLKGVVERLSIMMLMEEQIADCQAWPCVVELDGFSLSAVSVALTVQQMERSRGWPLLEVNRATKKLVNDVISNMPPINAIM